MFRSPAALQLPLGCALALAAVVSDPAGAHDSAFSTLQLEILDERIAGIWELSIEVAWIVTGFDSGATVDLDRLRERERALGDRLRDRIRLSSEAGACQKSAQGHAARL